MGASLKDRLPPDRIATTDQGEVYIYSVGPFRASVCAPAALGGEDVAAAVERHRPCGTASGWTVSADVNFATGQPNPCICEDDSGRRHWLLDA